MTHGLQIPSLFIVCMLIEIGITVQLGYHEYQGQWNQYLQHAQKLW